MSIRNTLTAAVALGAIALVTAACTPAADEAETARDTGTTTIIEREVPAAPIVIEREVAVPAAPVVVETDRRDGDTTTVRAGSNGIEVETTNR